MLLTLTLIAALASVAHAQDATNAGAAEVPAAPSAPVPAPAPCAGAHVVLRAAPDVPAELVREVETDLAAELGRRGLAVCADGVSAIEPAAVVSLSLRERDAIIELDDRTTHKRVARDVRLDRVPPAGRALALAIAIDELLRASWAELTMREEEEEAPAPPPAAPPRAEPVPESAPPESDEPRDTRVRLGAGLGYVHSWSDYDAFALLLDGELSLGQRGFVGLSLGPSLALPVDTAYGQVSTYGATSAFSLGACVPFGERVLGCAGARAGVELVVFSGDANAQAHSQSGAAWVVRAEGFVGPSFDLTKRLRLRAQVGLGAPLHGVRARASETTLVGISGVLVSTQLTLQVEL